ncbi:MAG: SRPBCC family protein [bacterium]|nr:SRPBCC family protein [bacterium]MCY4258357.1 SRPBCC family protein [bacterium]
MEMSNEIEVNASVSDVWQAFNDVERIAPCLPGAQLTEIEDEEYRGVVKVKVGPVNAQYKGKATFVERDEDTLKVVILAEGRETRGQGNASAQITAVLEDLGDERTKVRVDTDLKITGKVAQIGRNLIPDVSAKIMGQFAENLEALLSDTDGANGSEVPVDDVASDPATAANANGDSSQAQSESGLRSVTSPEPEAVDLLGVAGAPVAKRAAPVAAGMVFLWLLRRIFKRRNKKSA